MQRDTAKCVYTRLILPSAIGFFIGRYTMNTSTIKVNNKVFRTVNQQKKLLTAIRKVIKMLEDKKSKYSWFKADNCNCGLLAQAILKTDSSSLGDLRYNQGYHTFGLWSDIAYVPTCTKTGLSLNKVFAELQRAGLTAKEIINTEKCSSLIVLRKMGKTSDYVYDVRRYSDKSFVTEYFKAWLELEKDRLANLIAAE